MGWLLLVRVVLKAINVAFTPCWGSEPRFGETRSGPLPRLGVELGMMLRTRWDTSGAKDDSF